jgi:Helix-turn-helix domain
MTDQVDLDEMARQVEERAKAQRIKEWMVSTPLSPPVTPTKWIQELAANPRRRPAALPRQHWAARLRVFMEGAGLSEADVAARSGIALDDLGRMLDGDRDPIPDERRRLASAVRMSEMDLFADPDASPRRYPPLQGSPYASGMRPA